MLDLKLPGGAPHVVLLSLLLLLADLREQAGTLLTPADNNSAKVLLRLPVQVRWAVGGMASAVGWCQEKYCNVRQVTLLGIIRLAGLWSYLPTSGVVQAAGTAATHQMCLLCHP